MESNPIIDKLPDHLKQFIKDQPYNDYTAVDQAVWRYIMRLNVHHLGKVAHGSYLDGLVKTGIEIESIPQMYGMNRILKEIGWAAVAVDGFIPPSAFMEFQAYNVLVIAADIRQLKHIQYTPAPDIIHEAAGHAPIIADPEYAEYLRYFGEIGSKALSSAKDFELYEAIRHLSIIKEYPFTPQDAIDEAEKRIDIIQSNMGEPSEMALIRRLHWWTVEYGLIGSIETPKIYGAGLLSSIGESVSCMKADVLKIPYTIEAMNCEFDITKPQPQLFVTPDFAHLTHVLDEFANTMALRKGGAYGIEKAIEAASIATAQMSSGLQISGIFDQLWKDDEQNLIAFATKGPSALAFANRQWTDHDKSEYRDGFIAVCSTIQNTGKALENYSETDMNEAGLITGHSCTLHWNGGLSLTGSLKRVRRATDGKILLLTFTNASLKWKDTYIMYDSPVFHVNAAEKVTSVFAGAADKSAFKDLPKVPAEHTYKVMYDTSTRRLHQIYQEVRDVRHGKDALSKLPRIFEYIKRNNSDDWLLSLEILELVHNQNEFKEFANQVLQHLIDLAENHKEFKQLINDGISLLDHQQLVNA
jgi:phenylalanine-4-hydroxylase